jgi:hypothetical protein
VIEQIMIEETNLRSQVEAFGGRRGEKSYIVLEEMLTRLLIKLDRIESDGRDDIRTARKNAVKAVNSTIDLLESRAAANAQEPKQDQVVQDDSVQDQTMQTDNVQQNCAPVADEMQTETVQQAAEDTTDANTEIREMTLDSEVAC